MALAEIVQRGWDAVAAGDMDTLVADYTEDIPDFRATVENLDTAVPAGFEVTGLRHIEGDGEVVTTCAWKSNKLEASQLAALFRFRDDKICEER